MAPRYRLCPKCKYRYERIKQKCPNCATARPKKRVPKHAETLRDHDYDYYKEVSRVLHGVTDESCCACRKPRAESRRHDRDHDHITGNPRGLLCVKCNKLLPRDLDIPRMRLLLAYQERAEKYPEKFTKPKGQNVEKESPPS